MTIISVSGIGKAYGVDTILENVSFHINKGDKVGIVGTNGAGKTTLMNMLSGQLEPDGGSIYISADTTIGYLTQASGFDSRKTVYEAMLDIFSDLRQMEEEMQDLTDEISRISEYGGDVARQVARLDQVQDAYQRGNGYGYKSEITGILNSLAFPGSFFDKYAGDLSGGEKTRLALAALLLRKPDILLLDEPTNHLDIGTLVWLEQFLRSYGGTILVISHDRYFLDHTVNRILDVENKTAVIYDGNYSQYAEKKRQRFETMMREYEKQQAEIKEQEALIRRYKERGTEKLAKRAASREKRLEHVERLDKPVQDNSKIKIKFKDSVKSGNDVLQGFELAKEFTNSAGRRVLFRNVDFDIKRGDRICIVGPNGTGKTTLLKIMIEEMEPTEGRIHVGHNVDFAYYDQEQMNLNPAETVLDELHNGYRLYDATELRGILGRFLFRDDDVFKKVGDLSGGEKARLSLLKVILSGANVLVMDEPTNHLDISSKEVFEAALGDFPGTVIMISHDRYLLNRVPTEIWELDEGKITKYPGRYDYFLEKKTAAGKGREHMRKLGSQILADEDGDTDSSTVLGGGAGYNSPDAGSKEAGFCGISQASAKEQRLLGKQEQALVRRLTRDKEKQENKIAELEGEISELETSMCGEACFNDHVKLAEMAKKVEQLKAELDEVYMAWMEISEELKDHETAD